MAPTQEVINTAMGRAYDQMGKPYAIGGPDGNGGWVVRGKPAVDDENPNEFDCSGFSKWVVARCGVILPDGCAAQIKFCSKLDDGELPLDLGFAALHGADVDHVVVVFDRDRVIEARGHQEGKDYGKVIIRPKSAWEVQKGFLGWYRVPGIRA